MEYRANVTNVVAGATGVVVFVWGLITFRKDAKLRQAEHFGRIREAFVSSPECERLLLHLDDSPLLQDEAPSTRENSARWRSRTSARANVLRSELAYHTFGYGAIRCANSNHFWSHNFPKNEEYWRLFFNFAREMEEVQKRKNCGDWKPHNVRI